MERQRHRVSGASGVEETIAVCGSQSLGLWFDVVQRVWWIRLGSWVQQQLSLRYDLEGIAMCSLRRFLQRSWRAEILLTITTHI